MHFIPFKTCPVCTLDTVTSDKSFTLAVTNSIAFPAEFTSTNLDADDVKLLGVSVIVLATIDVGIASETVLKFVSIEIIVLLMYHPNCLGLNQQWDNLNYNSGCWAYLTPIMLLV